MENNFNLFNGYGYIENNRFTAKTYEVNVSPVDNIISITENGDLLASVKLGIDKQTLSLIGKDGSEFSSVELPLVDLIKDASYDNERKTLIIKIVTSNGEEKDIEVSLSNLLDNYATKDELNDNVDAINEEISARTKADMDMDLKFSNKDNEIEASILSLTNDVNEELAKLSENDNKFEAKHIELDEKDVSLEAKDEEIEKSINNLSELITSEINNLTIRDDEIENKIPKGIYNLGEVESFNNLDEIAAEKGICDNQDNVILTFKITTVPYGEESGFILNIRNGNKISQSLFWKQSLTPQMYRELTIDDNGDISNVDFYPYDTDTNYSIYKDSLPSQLIFTLTTESDSETIKSSLTDVLQDKNPITKEQLDECLKYGYYLLESSMRVPVYVGWDGSSYTLTMFGLPNPKGDLIAATVSISISDDNSVYAITKNGSKATILTSNNIAKNDKFIGLESNDSLLSSKILLLEEKLDKIYRTNVENVVLNSESEVSYNDSTKDYIISGSETKNTEINGKTVRLSDLTITNNARTSINSNDIEFKNININGDFPKSDGNAAINLNNAEFIVIKDMTFNSNDIYNGIEIGLNSEILPKSILFENCNFLGDFSNNAILIFGTEQNAIININNCYFEKVSNPIRLSNNKNTSCILNIINCKVDAWDENNQHRGLVLMQDYTSKSIEEAISNNLFSPDKITINVINTIGPNNKKITMPSDISSICGTNNDKQIFYVWDDYRNLVPYDATQYPKISVQ